MAAYATAKGIRQLGFHHHLHHHYQFPEFRTRQNSQLVIKSTRKRLFLVDTLALVRRLEDQGIPTKQAEVMTRSILDVFNGSLDTVVQSFVAKAEMQKIKMTQDSNLFSFKSKIQSSERNHFAQLQHDTEKLKVDIEKMRDELRYEIDKVTAGQRLELNLEKGRIHDELTNQIHENTSLTNKLDKEIYELRAQVEASKNDVMKYCVGTLASLSAVALAVLRILTN